VKRASFGISKRVSVAGGKAVKRPSSPALTHLMPTTVPASHLAKLKLVPKLSSRTSNPVTANAVPTTPPKPNVSIRSQVPHTRGTLRTASAFSSPSATQSSKSAHLSNGMKSFASALSPVKLSQAVLYHASKVISKREGVGTMRNAPASVPRNPVSVRLPHSGIL